MIGENFGGRILPFDSPAAVAFAEIAATRRQAGRPISQADAQIAAIARSRGAALATRNVPDFEGCGVEIVNPWTGAGA
jgi:predicted nucleic acid-binding protein